MRCRDDLIVLTLRSVLAALWHGSRRVARGFGLHGKEVVSVTADGAGAPGALSPRLDIRGEGLALRYPYRFDLSLFWSPAREYAAAPKRQTQRPTSCVARSGFPSALQASTIDAMLFVLAATATDVAGICLYNWLSSFGISS